MRKRLLVALLALGAAAACSFRKSPAEKEFEQALGRTSLTVFPTVVRLGRVTQCDLESARELSAAFERRGLGKAIVRKEPVAFALRGSFNQAKMYRQSRDAFAAYVKAHPPGTQYAAMAEYLISTSGQVGGIHLYVVRADGEPVGGVLLNSHWKEFREVKPKTASEATRALLLRLERIWEAAGTGQRG
jgi:hypothetical protein